MSRKLFLLLLTAVVLIKAGGQSYFPLPAITDTAQFNNNLRRTAALLHSSVYNQPTEVRILVYGQSISVQEWWKTVKQFVERKFPTAKLRFENKAIGGFSTERLKLMVDNDIISFYPDLVLFHDYGNEQDYEKIIQIIRRRTTAEIAVQTDHLAMQTQEWHDTHSSVWLPALSKQYGLAIIDVRKVWKQYLQQNKVEIKDLLSDGVHLNAHGNYLMAAIVTKYFAGLQPQTMQDSMVEEYDESEHFPSPGKTLKMYVTGNRVDLVLDEKSKKEKKIEVMVDGKPPRALTDCYYYTRPTLDSTTSFLKKIGQPLAMQLGGNVVEQDWTMNIVWVDSVQQQVGFTVQGSITGEDGVGRSDSTFVSLSKAITITPELWFRAQEFAGFPWVAKGDVIHWQTRSMCIDKVKTGAARVVTVVQGIANKKHRLKLKGKGVKMIQAIRVYAPPLK